MVLVPRERIIDEVMKIVDDWLSVWLYLSAAKNWLTVNKHRLNKHNNQRILGTLKASEDNEEPVKLLGFWMDTKLNL